MIFYCYLEGVNIPEKLFLSNSNSFFVVLLNIYITLEAYMVSL